ncbi:MAG: hypothetical protein JXJ17_12660 [Anaerolineae bacterium]|nr:hypothetical protein [Anaerolineae bacterium]
MYTINVVVRGIVPLLQRRFAPETLDTMLRGSATKSIRVDYSSEWMTGMYIDDDGFLYEPATHLEGALVKAAASYRIKGQGYKTYRDVFRAQCQIAPDQIPVLFDGNPIPRPGPELFDQPTVALSVDIQRVVVSKAAVPRARLKVHEGWELAFTVIVQDDALPAAIVRTILEDAGRSSGLGDFRPRYGRFEVVRFEVGDKDVLEAA